MKDFAALFRNLEDSNRTNDKIKSLVQYFEKSSDLDVLWAVSLLLGKRPRRPVKTTLMRAWATELANIPEWLFEASYENVGDLGETLALILPQKQISNNDNNSLRFWIEDIILPLRDMDEEEQKEKVIWAWKNLNKDEKLLFNKLIGGSFRIGVSDKITIKALSKFLNQNENVLSHKLMGDWQPNLEFYQGLKKSELLENISQPYPFCLAYAIEESIMESPANNWFFEWKWDGIRAQFIHRNGEFFIWSRGEELISDRFPELANSDFFKNKNFVVDGEILVWKDNSPGSFQDLQQRIGRKNPTAAWLKKVPIRFMVYDILEFEGEDLRNKTLRERRSFLNQLFLGRFFPELFKLSELFEFHDWDSAKKWREGSREAKSEGLMIKKKDSPYHIGRKKGDWWKWKLDPFTIDAVLIYAQKGSGRRAGLYTDYTFGVWESGKLLPVAKAYSGLSDAEIKEVDAFIKAHTLEKFGPVRTVKPELVFEIAFEGIQLSTRHKTGIAVRFPRISRWRKDKKVEEADHLEGVKSLLNSQ